MQDHPVFGVIVPEKGWVPAPTYLLRRYRVLQILGALHHGEVLEVGCGAGALSRDLARRGFNVHAFDTSPAAYEIATYVNKDNPRVHLYSKAQEDWNSRFDYVIALEVLEHIVDDRTTLEQWGSWLQPGGYLLLSVPAHSRRWNASDEWAGHIRRYERTELESLLRSCGFSIRNFECYGVPLANLIDPIRARYHAKSLKFEPQKADHAKHTERSGVQRSLERRLFFIQASWPGIKLMQLFCTMQSWFSQTDLGNGYLVLAQRQ